MRWSDWQFWCAAKFGEIRAGLVWEGEPLGNQAFRYRRMQVVLPQKMGKGPWAATMCALQAVGPAEFCGFAQEGDVYRCADWGCPCGFVFEYMAGEPMGRPHPSPLLQITATSEDQTDNTYRPLRSMIRLGPLKWLLKDLGTFVRVLGHEGGEDADRIDVVTASADSKVGNPVSFVVQDETGLWTASNRMTKLADNQRRGLAGMSGRSIETTNAWNTAVNSVAQQTFESPVDDVFRFYPQPPAQLRWSNAAERRKILEYVYMGTPWVNLDSIEAEAQELNHRDPEQAERFFGNRSTYASGTWLSAGLWEGAYGMDGEPA